MTFSKNLKTQKLPQKYLKTKNKKSESFKDASNEKISEKTIVRIERY